MKEYQPISSGFEPDEQDLFLDRDDFRKMPVGGRKTTQKYGTVTAIIILSFLSLFLGSVMYVTISGSQSGGTPPVIFGANISTDPTRYFSLKRVNYDALSYFTNLDPEYIFKYAFLEGYDSVLEPHADMEIKLFDTSSVNTFTFRVCPSPLLAATADDESGGCQEASRVYNSTLKKAFSGSINFACKPYDQFSVEVYETDPATGLTSNHYDGKALCIYVRRELRKLTSADRESLVSAMYELWTTVNEADGVRKYGRAFHNIMYLLKFHHFNAADRKTDHIHNGNGIIMQHIKFTNIFEASLQSILPALALPYWDFTVDAASNLRINESFAMNPSMFGGLTRPKVFTQGFTAEHDRIASGAIPSGRWANFLSDFNEDFPDMQFGYGYMRAPWNLNPSPFVSRFTFNFSTYKLPSCSDHFNLLNFNNMMTFFDLGEFAPHGNMHILQGGAYGCDYFQPLMAEGHIKDEESMHKLCIIWSPVFLKSAFRYHYLTPQKDCSPNLDALEQSECKFECDPSTYDDLYEFVLALSGGGDQIAIDATVEGSKEAWLDFICSGNGRKIFSGDHYESASPIDPSFWLIHPPLERLLHVKFMGGGFLNEEWYTDPQTQKVCDFAQCFSEETGQIDYYEDCCYGHYEGDRLQDAISADRSKYFGPTNGETLAATDPRQTSYSMNYIYDSFTWGHCEEDFVGRMEEMYVNMQLVAKKKAEGEDSEEGSQGGEESGESVSSGV